MALDELVRVLARELLAPLGGRPLPPRSEGVVPLPPPPPFVTTSRLPAKNYRPAHPPLRVHPAHLRPPSSRSEVPPRPYDPRRPATWQQAPQQPRGPGPFGTTPPYEGGVWLGDASDLSRETITALPPLRLPKKRSGIVGTPLKTRLLRGERPTPE